MYRDLRRLGLALLQLREPGEAVRAVPEEAFYLDEEVVREATKPLFWAELEEGVGLEARLLGLGELPGGDGGLDPVEGGRDDVEVGGRARVLPLVGVEGVDGPSASSVAAWTSSGSATASWRRRGEVGRQLSRISTSAACPPRSRCEQVLEVAEGLGGSVPEGDGLLDLEVERHFAVVGAPFVLDRDEGEEALELPGPP